MALHNLHDAGPATAQARWNEDLSAIWPKEGKLVCAPVEHKAFDKAEKAQRMAMDGG